MKCSNWSDVPSLKRRSSVIGEIQASISNECRDTLGNGSVSCRFDNVTNTEETEPILSGSLGLLPLAHTVAKESLDGPAVRLRPTLLVARFLGRPCIFVRPPNDCIMDWNISGKIFEDCICVFVDVIEKTCRCRLNKTINMRQRAASDVDANRKVHLTFTNRSIRV
jgi:hypothetical protein